MAGDADLAAVGALLSDRTRATILLTLLNGGMTSASALAGRADVSRPLASAHLRKLTEGGLITVEPHGRHRFYRLSSQRVADALESLILLSPATQVTFTNGQVSIPLAQVADGDLHRFQATENGMAIRFWLYQKPDGKVATVFDACEICGSVGFYKGPNGVVCKNCAAPINPQSVGTAGGCNPIPLKATQTTDSVIIQEADIAAGSRVFEKQ